MVLFLYCREGVRPMAAGRHGTSGLGSLISSFIIIFLLHCFRSCKKRFSQLLGGSTVLSVSLPCSARSP